MIHATSRIEIPLVRVILSLIACWKTSLRDSLSAGSFPSAIPHISLTRAWPTLQWEVQSHFSSVSVPLIFASSKSNDSAVVHCQPHQEFGKTQVNLDKAGMGSD